MKSEKIVSIIYFLITSAQSVSYLIQYMHGHIRSWTVAFFQRSRSVCECFTNNKDVLV